MDSSDGAGRSAAHSDARLTHYRRVTFKPLAHDDVLEAIPAYHPIYADAQPELLLFVDEYCGHGNFRNWASFTHSATRLCQRRDQRTLSEQTARNVFALMGGGAGAA